MASSINFINPDTLARPPSYTQVVETIGPGRTIYISGQLGADRDGQLVSADFRAQAVQVFENLKCALAAAGAQFTDVVKLNSYLIDIAQLPVLREVRAGYLDPSAPPASTTLAVAGFARAGALLEIEAIAVVPQNVVRGARRSARPRGRKLKPAARKRR